jgi:hypothetical protein
MSDEPENHTLALLREMRAEMQRGFQQVTEAFEKVYLDIAEVKAEVLKCRADVTGGLWLDVEEAVRTAVREESEGQ